MARLDLPDKYRDEDSSERRKWTRRLRKRGGRRSTDKLKGGKDGGNECISGRVQENVAQAE